MKLLEVMFIDKVFALIFSLSAVYGIDCGIYDTNMGAKYDLMELNRYFILYIYILSCSNLLANVQDNIFDQFIKLYIELLVNHHI